MTAEGTINAKALMGEGEAGLNKIMGASVAGMEWVRILH